MPLFLSFIAELGFHLIQLVLTTSCEARLERSLYSEH